MVLRVTGFGLMVREGAVRLALCVSGAERLFGRPSFGALIVTVTVVEARMLCRPGSSRNDVVRRVLKAADAEGIAPQLPGATLTADGVWTTA